MRASLKFLLFTVSAVLSVGLTGYESIDADHERMAATHRQMAEQARP